MSNLRAFDRKYGAKREESIAYIFMSAFSQSFQLVRCKQGCAVFFFSILISNTDVAGQLEESISTLPIVSIEKSLEISFTS